MSTGITSMTDLGLTARTADIDAAANASNTDGGGCGGGCNCTCGANDSVDAVADETSAPAKRTITAEYLVTGMTCNHCVMSVSEEIFDLEGVLNVNVDLVKDGNSKVTIDSSTPLDPEAVRAAIVVAGYELAAR